MPTVRRRVATALYRSLRDDPFYATIAAELGSGTTAFEAALLRYFEYSMDEAERWGKLVLDDAGLGAAVWSLPGDPAAVHLARTEKTRVLRHALGDPGLSAYRRITSFMSERSKSRVAPEAWYLSIVGIAPEAQGRGRGGKLLDPTLEEADAVLTPCYLETFSQRSERFYARLGFQTVGAYTEPTTGARYSLMLRRPRPAASSTAPIPSSTG